jgi:peptide/nickel transport system substrate-binding protein
MYPEIIRGGDTMKTRGRRPVYLSATIGLLLLAFLTACAQATPPVPKEGVTPVAQETPKPIAGETPTVAAQQVTTPGEQVKEGGSVTFVLSASVEGFDPNRFRGRFFDLFIESNVYDRLISRDPVSGEFYGNLADSWEVSEDGLVYTFHLKKGITFHDGTPFNAEAVKFNIDRIRDEHSSARVATLISPVTEVNVLDEYTVEFKLSAPYGPLMDNLSTPILSIVSPTAAKEYGEELAKHPVGSGPFKFKEWVVDEYVLLEKNPDYNWAPAFAAHQGPAYLDQVKIVFITEEGSRLAAFEAGEVDILYYPPLREVKRFLEDPKYTVVFIKRPGVPRILGLNMEHWPFDDAKVRQAIAYAIDTKGMQQTVFEGVGTEAHSMLCPGTFGYSEAIEAKWPRYDPEKAKALLKEAGFTLDAKGIWEKDGKTFSPVLWSISDPFFTHMGEFIAADLQDIGIDVKHETYEQAAYLEGAYQGKPDMVGILQFSTDADTLWNIAHSSSKLVNANVAFYDNPKVDDLLQQARSTADQKKRFTMYEEIQQIMMQDMPYVPYLCQHDVNIFSTKLAGIRHEPMGPAVFYDLHYTR